MEAGLSRKKGGKSKMENNKVELVESTWSLDHVSLEEFSITELEERLEFFPKCTINIPK
jgi:hypothetical protein